MGKHKYEYDLIVIGSGAGGGIAATSAARAGKRVALVEAEAFGGEAPNYSDIPMHALIHAATLLDQSRRGAKFGLRSGTMQYNFPTLQQWKDVAIRRTGAGGNRAFYEHAGITTITGTARFVSPHEISVGHRRVTGERFLIASGSQWVAPDIPGLADIGCVSPRDIITASRLPRSVYIIGATPTGVELAQLLAVLGVKVYIAEIAGRLLPGYDEEIGVLLANVFEKHHGITVLTHTRTLSAGRDAMGKVVTYSHAGREHKVRVDEIIGALDRAPRTDIGLENAGVVFDAHSITTNEFMQTNAKHIYAAGDVAGKSRQAHMALTESKAVAHNLLNKKPIVPDYTSAPTIIYTHPEIATVGLSQDDCLKRDLKVRTALAPLSVTARSNTSDMREGFVKLVADKKGVLLGATVMAPGAGEMIHELSLAIRYGLTAEQVAAVPHAYLSWSEAIRSAASQLTK